MLTEMLDAPVAAAVSVCHAAQDAACEAADMQMRLERADGANSAWLDPLREQAYALGLHAAELMVTAHARAEEVEGIARAVGQARARMPWTPRSAAADMEFLMAAHRAG